MKNKYYICKDPNFPESDLWVEMTGTSCGNPALQIFGKNENGSVCILNLSMAEAARLSAILSEKFLTFSAAFLQKSEEE